MYYKDIKEERVDTVHDLLQALFETERRLLIDSLDSGFQPNPKNYHKQFDVSFNKEQEECLVTATNIGDDSITPKNMIQMFTSCYVRTCVISSDGSETS